MSALLRRLERLEARAGQAAPADQSAAPDPVAWAEATVGIQLDLWQRELLRDEAPRTLLLCSRQVGKSFATALKAAYTTAFTPGTVLVCSPSLRQSSLMFSTIERTLKAASPALHFAEANRTTIAVSGGGRVVCLPGDRPDLCRGFASSLVLLDEACFIKDAVPQVVMPMLATTGGRIIALSSPAGPVGWFYDQWTGDAEWKRIRVLATDCPRIPETFIEDARRRLGSIAFRQEILAEFVQAADALFSADDLDRLFATNRNENGAPWLSKPAYPDHQPFLK